MTHDFNEELLFSHELADAPWWEEVYRQAFPDFLSMVDLRKDGWHQRAGRDRAVVLSTGKTLYVDEKGRRKSYPDILVEIWSVYPPGRKPPYVPVPTAKPGWACEPKDTDWLAYAFVPTRTCHLLPMLALRTAWVKKGRTWMARADKRRDGFSYAVAANKGYDTISVAVPIAILYQAMNNAMTVTWTDAEPAPTGGYDPWEGIEIARPPDAA